MLLTVNGKKVDLRNQPCPICSANGRLSPTRVNIGPGIIYHCDHCDGRALLPPGTINYVNSGWTERRFDLWEEDIARAKALAPRLVEQVQALLGKPISSVLEVGCGSGFMGVGFASEGIEYTGTEVDEGGIDWARQNGVDAHAVAAEDLHSWADGRHFDLIISSNVYEHVDNPGRAFAALGKMNAGLIALIVPNAMGLIANLKSFGLVRRLATRLTANRATAWSIDGTWHNIGYSASTLETLAQESGLSIERLTTTSINDPVWGFVQPNHSLRYRIAEKIEGIAQRRTALLMLARPIR